jgi:hypothetical protein
MEWLRKLLRLEKPAPPRVMLSDDVIHFSADGTTPVSMAIGDLAAVVIETNDSGPWGDDVVWHLLGRADGSALSVPQSAENFSPLLERLQSLPGFDNEAVIEAMGSTALNAFLCWEADEAVRPDSNVLAFARFGRSKRKDSAR